MKRKTLLCFRTVFTERRNLAITSSRLATRHRRGKDLLQRRLLESIQFELNACSKEVVQEKQRSYQIKQWQNSTGCIGIKNESLENLRELFDERYQIFGWTRKWSKATRFFVSMEELRTCYPLRSLCLKKYPRSLYQATIAISKRCIYLLF